MKTVSNLLVLSFGLKCLIMFCMKEGSLADGLFLLATVIYFFTMVDLKLPQDEGPTGLSRRDK
jgi:hypothetical protein